MIQNVLKKVFSNPIYIVLAVTVTISVFAFAVWLPHGKLISTIITSPSVSFIEAVGIMFGLFLSIGTNFTAVSASYTIAIALLFGINIALLTYYISQRKGSFPSRGGAFGVGGLVSGVFGIGCAACGTFILTSVLALVGAGSIITFLPLGGEELGLIGVALIGYATYWTAKKIAEPVVCK